MIPQKLYQSHDMKANQKRKGQWSSRVFFQRKAAGKVQVTEQLLNQPSNEPKRGSTVVNTSMDGCSIDNPRAMSNTAAKLRRTGSKLLSIVSFSGSSGMPLEFFQAYNSDQ